MAPDGRWVACRPEFFLSVRVLSRLYRRLFLERLQSAFDAGAMNFFGDLTPLADPAAFTAHLRPLRQIDWVVYAKRPFGGPQQVLDYLGRYTHRVAIANSRIIGTDDAQVRFRWKDYRQPDKPKVMTLNADEFIPTPCCTFCPTASADPPLRFPRQRSPHCQARRHSHLARRAGA